MKAQTLPKSWEAFSKCSPERKPELVACRWVSFEPLGSILITISSLLSVVAEFPLLSGSISLLDWLARFESSSSSTSSQLWSQPNRITLHAPTCVPNKSLSSSLDTVEKRTAITLTVSYSFESVSIRSSQLLLLSSTFQQRLLRLVGLSHRDPIVCLIRRLVWLESICVVSGWPSFQVERSRVWLEILGGFVFAEGSRQLCRYHIRYTQLVTV